MASKIKTIEPSRFIKKNDLNRIEGGNTEICDVTRYFSCDTPYNINCALYASCKQEFEITICGEKHYSCTEFYVQCYANHALCLPNIKYATPCPTKKLVD